MSLEAMAIAMNHSRAVAGAKLVLMGIANHDGDGGSWPSIARLARYAHIKPRTVKKHIKTLEALGETVRMIQQGGERDTEDVWRPNLYRFTLECPDNCKKDKNHTLCAACGPEDYRDKKWLCPACEKKADVEEAKKAAEEAAAARAAEPDARLAEAAAEAAKATENQVRESKPNSVDNSPKMDDSGVSSVTPPVLEDTGGVSSVTPGGVSPVTPEPSLRTARGNFGSPNLSTSPATGDNSEPKTEPNSEPNRATVRAMLNATSPRRLASKRRASIRRIN